MKKLLIINGYPDNPKYSDYESQLTQIVANISHAQVHYFVLRDMNINYCTGCWSCWYKTPGLCSIKDDYEQILRLVPHVDDIVILSPIILGYESALIKKFKDRIIPTAHPYIRIHEKEMHHHQRYNHTANFDVILLEDSNTTPEDVERIKDLYHRVSLNFDSTVHSFFSSQSIGGVHDVINAI